MKRYYIVFLLMMFGFVQTSNAMDIKGHIDSINEKNIIIRFDGNSFGLVGDVAKVTFIEVDGNERVIGKWQIESSQGRLAVAEPLEVLEAPGVGQSVVIYATGPRVKKTQPGGGFVPDLLGKKLIAAKKKLADIGFKVKTKAGQSAPSPEQEFTVSAVEPAPGTQLAKGSEVTLTSFVKHQQLLSVPDVVGLTGTKAEKRLTKVGLKAEIKITKPAPAKDKTFVTIHTEPFAGSDVAKGSKVIVVTYGSYKPIKVVVPYLIGKKVSNAKSKLFDIGFKVKTIAGQSASSPEQEFTVSAMEPAPGTQLAKGSGVTLISFVKHQKSISVPDVVGLTGTKAEKRLARAGLQADIKITKPAPAKDKTFVTIRTEPSAGSDVAKGSKVIVVTYGSYKPIKVVVPSLVGKQVKEAETALTKLGLKINKRHSDKDTPDKQSSSTILSQEPEAGVKVNKGDIVELVHYGVYESSAVLPDLLGEKISNAKPKLINMGFKVKTQAGQPAPDKDREYTVSKMKPAPGTRFDKGKEVILTSFVKYRQQISIPEVVGLNEQKAKEKLTGIGLKTKVVFANPAPTKNDSLTVAKTTPPVGSAVHQGNTVTLVVYPQFVDNSSDSWTEGNDSGVGSGGDPWVDKVVSFTRPFGSSDEGFEAGSALGPPSTIDKDLKFVAIDKPETIIFAFTDNVVVNSEGNDLKLYEYMNGDSLVEVFVSTDNISYISLGKTAHSTEYDLANYDISTVRYVKLVGLADGGAAKGYDLMAIEALNSSGKDYEPVTSASDARSEEEQEKSSDGEIIFSDSADSFGGGKADNTKNTVSGENCESYNQCLAEMMQQIQQLSLKMVSGQSSTLGCQYLGLGQAMVRVSKDANSAGCPIAGNYEHAGDMIKEQARQMCGGQTIPFDIDTLPGCR